MSARDAGSWLENRRPEAQDRRVAVAAPPAAQEWQLPATLRRALILAPPLVLAVYEIFHPRPDQTVEAVMDVAGWFTLFHVIQLFLIPFLILSIGLLAQDLGVLGHARRARCRPRLLQRLRRHGRHQHRPGHARRTRPAAGAAGRGVRDRR